MSLFQGEDVGSIPAGATTHSLYINMRIRYGHFEHENLAPLRLLGFYWDVNYDGSYMLAFCFWKWFIGISMKNSS